MHRRRQRGAEGGRNLFWIFIHDTDKVEKGLMMLFFGLAFVFSPSPENFFSADAIGCMLCVCHLPLLPLQHKLVLFACLSSDWATTTGRLLDSKMGNSSKCLSQGHSNAPPLWESDQCLTTFRLLARRSSN